MVKTCRKSGTGNGTTPNEYAKAYRHRENYGRKRAQQALHHRASCNRAARLDKYNSLIERKVT